LPHLPTGTVTFLFTDLEGSTRRWEDDPAAMRTALARHDEILRDAVVAHDGVIVKTTGDGVHAAFTSAHAAVGAAADAQRALHEERWTSPTPLRVRMGLHTGEAELRAGDYYGPALNRAARLMSAAHGGQIVVSRATEELVRDHLPFDLDLVDLGDHRLRDLNRPERVFQVAVAGLPSEFPPLQSLDAQPGNLTPAITELVGRDGDVDAVVTALGRARVVTITGAGGVGKTRLAIETAWRVRVEYPDGAWLCELAAAREPSAVAEVIAATLSVAPRPGMSVAESVGDYLRTKSLLLVVDNCEHQLDAVWELVGSIARGAPTVRVLATSREGLGVDGEQIVPLRSLPVPAEAADNEAIVRSDAVKLFVERATAADPRFRIETCATAVAEICRRLDGIPLALELAAARTVAMRPAEIAAVLDERFRLLTGGRRTTVQRHQTLRATVDWSYALLTDSERAVFDRLGVFSGTFDLDAVEAVVVDDEISPWDARDAIAGLVAKSMLVIDDTSSEASRYRLLETLREYAANRLDEAGVGETWRRRHAAYYAEFAMRAGSGLCGPDELSWRPRVRREADNLRAAVTWSLGAPARADQEFAVTIVSHFAYQAAADYDIPVSDWAWRAIDAAERSTPGRRAAVLAAAAWTPLHRGEAEAARQLAESALRDGIRPDSPAPLMPLQILSVTWFVGGDIPAALEANARAAVAVESAAVDDPFGLALLATTRHAFQVMSSDEADWREGAVHALAVARASGAPSAISVAGFTRAIRIWHDDPATGAALLDEAITCIRAGGAGVVAGYAFAVRAQIYSREGNHLEALSFLREAVTTSRDKGDIPMLVTVVGYAIQIFTRAEGPLVAARCIGFAVVGPYAALWNLPPTEADDNQWAQDEVRRALGSNDYETETARGSGMSVDDIASALVEAIDDAIRDRSR
jgi:predicted ATPase/class 3 adenylate cyclase